MLRRRSLLQTFLVAPAGIAWVRSVQAQPRGVELALVVAKDSPLKELSFADLRRVFTSEPITGPSGRRIVPFNHPPHTPDRVAFDRLVLGMSASDVAKFWLDRRIRGQSGAPRTVDSLAMLLKVVAKLPGAIGYVRPQFISPEVTAIKLDGLLPGKPGYKLIFSE
jgi:ABC-type phosphate transport system substrate-binding protein